MIKSFLIIQKMIKKIDLLTFKSMHISIWLLSPNYSILALKIMIKFVLKSVSGAKFDVEVEPTDKIAVLDNVLMTNNKITENQQGKYIFLGKVLDHEKTFDEHGITDGAAIVFIAVNKTTGVVVQNVPTPSPVQAVPVEETSIVSAAPAAPTASVAPVQEVPVPNPEPANALPETFMGLNINMIRQVVFSAVMSTVLSNSAVFLEILKSVPQMQQIRAMNPEAFDGLITHPDFLKGIITSVVGDEENEAQQAQQVGSQLSDEDRQFIKELHTRTVEFGGNITPGEITQMYLVCDKNRDATTNMVMDSLFN